MNIQRTEEALLKINTNIDILINYKGESSKQDIFDNSFSFQQENNLKNFKTFINRYLYDLNKILDFSEKDFDSLQVNIQEWKDTIFTFCSHPDMKNSSVEQLIISIDHICEY